jgi:hypothetical protein
LERGKPCRQVYQKKDRVLRKFPQQSAGDKYLTGSALGAILLSYETNMKGTGMQRVTTVEDTSLARHADKLHSALVALGPGWHGRADIARQLGRPRLVSYDTQALEWLVATGRIEAERHEIEGPIPQRWEYRVKS